jgi:1,2-diacylglycerol 3-beta-galactosyltransferase
MKRILILMSKTGGGHLASAKALKEAFDATFQNQFDIEIVDLLKDHLSFPINRLPAAYDMVVNRAPTFWRVLWHTMASPKVGTAAARTVIISARKRIESLIRERRPDLILSVHPLVNHLVIPIMNKIAPDTLYATVVTDLETVHPLWLHPQADATFVPSQKIAVSAAARGIDANSIHTIGLPVRSEFSEQKPDRQELRRQLGLNPDLPTVLITGGGGGVGGLTKIVERTVKANCPMAGRHPAPIQIAVVCGRNARVQQALSNRQWPIPVIVFGFVDRMSDVMYASDLIVTKAGPGTIAEATICGLPIILSGFIPGQEEGNVRYVVDNSAGLYLPRASDIAAAVSQLLGPDKSELAAMASRSKMLGKPNAATEIVQAIAELIERQPERLALSKAM